MANPSKTESQLADRNGKPMISTQTALVADAPAGGTGATGGAYDTAGHRDAAIATINSIKACLISHGLMSDT